MSAAPKLTERQRTVFVAVIQATFKKTWYRAADSGERVTLASLYRQRLLDRRPWRGVNGERDTAYEYQATAQVVEVVKEKRA